MDVDVWMVMAMEGGGGGDAASTVVCVMACQVWQCGAV